MSCRRRAHWMGPSQYTAQGHCGPGLEQKVRTCYPFSSLRQFQNKSTQCFTTVQQSKGCFEKWTVFHSIVGPCALQTCVGRDYFSHCRSSHRYYSCRKSDRPSELFPHGFSNFLSVCLISHKSCRWRVQLRGPYRYTAPTRRDPILENIMLKPNFSQIYSKLGNVWGIVHSGSVLG